MTDLLLGTLVGFVVALTVLVCGYRGASTFPRRSR
jgi:hypothetical protein